MYPRRGRPEIAINLDFGSCRLNAVRLRYVLIFRDDHQFHAIVEFQFDVIGDTDEQRSEQRRRERRSNRILEFGPWSEVGSVPGGLGCHPFRTCRPPG